MKKRLIIGALAAALTILQPNILTGQKTLTKPESWEEMYINETEIKEEYKYSYDNYPRRKYRITKEGDKYFGEYWREKIEVPKEYIDTIINHIDEAKKEGYYEYLFWRDLNHCHGGLPKDHMKKEYAGLNDLELKIKAMNDPKLMLLYHSRENLNIDNPKNKNRNFLGYFDGRPIKLIQPKNPNEYNTVFDYNREDMEQHDNYSSDMNLGFYFRAHKDGLFELSDGTRLDIEL